MGERATKTRSNVWSLQDAQIIDGPHHRQPTCRNAFWCETQQAKNTHTVGNSQVSRNQTNSCTDPQRPIVAKTETTASKFQLQRPPQQRSKTQRCVKDRGVGGKSHSGIGVVSVPAAPIVFLFAQNVGRPLVKRQD